MIVYLIAPLLTAVAAFTRRRLPKQGKIALLLLVLLYVVMLVGLRYRVGVDTIAYMSEFRTIPAIDRFLTINFLESHYEPGYLLICSVCKTFTNEFWPVQLIFGGITNGCIFLFLYRNCRNVFIGVLLYFVCQWFYFSFEIMRESAAVGIFLLNYRNLERRRWGRYYLLSLLSLSFHFSAMIVWFIPLTRFLRVNVWFVLVCIASLAVTPLVEHLNRLIHIASITGRLDHYLENADLLNLNARLGVVLRAGVPAMLLLSAWLIRGIRSRFVHLVLLQILLCCATFAIPDIFLRFINYTSLFVTAGIANLLTTHRIREWTKIALVSLVLLSQSHFFYINHTRWIPYVSIFNPHRILERDRIFRHDFWH